MKWPCNYCGEVPANGMDQASPLWGFIGGNVVPCCSVCRRVKGYMSKAEFLHWVMRIHRRVLT